MKVLIVKNEYADCPKTYYNWEDPAFYMSSILEEVKVNLDEGYSIDLKVVEMTEKEFDKIPELK